MIVAHEDVWTVETLIVAIREHHDLHTADDPTALDELLGDAERFLLRMRAELPQVEQLEPIDWDGLPY